MRKLLLPLALTLLATAAGAGAAEELHATYNGRFVQLSLNGTFPAYRVERAPGEGEFRLLLLNETGCTGICNYQDYELGAAGVDFRYRIRVLNPDGSVDTYGPTPLLLDQTQILSLHSVATPNPAPARTNILFSVPASIAQTGEVPVVVTLHDVRGREVARLWESTATVGSYEVAWDGHDGTGRPLASGSYFYRIQAGFHREVGRLVLIR